MYKPEYKVIFFMGACRTEGEGLFYKRGFNESSRDTRETRHFLVNTD